MLNEQWRSDHEAEKVMPPRNRFAKIFASAMYQFSTFRKMSVTNDITDWPLPNKIIGWAAVHNLITISHNNFFLLYHLFVTKNSHVSVSVPWTRFYVILFSLQGGCAEKSFVTT